MVTRKTAAVTAPAALMIEGPMLVTWMSIVVEATLTHTALSHTAPRFAVVRSRPI